MLDKIKFYWDYIQSLLDIDGDVWVGMFALCFMLRLLAPLKGYQPMNMAEAGMWGATIASFAYSNRGPK